jgi:hypothetical protein
VSVLVALLVDVWFNNLVTFQGRHLCVKGPIKRTEPFVGHVDFLCLSVSLPTTLDQNIKKKRDCQVFGTNLLLYWREISLAICYAL